MLTLMMRWMKAAGYRLRFGKQFSFRGVPCIERRASVKLVHGKVSIGRGFTMKEGAFLAVMNGGAVEIGDSVSLGRNAVVVCHQQVTIGEQCAIAPNVAIYDHDHRFGPQGLLPGYRTAPIIIEKNCWIGSGVTILRGTHIGEGCVIGAGCVVKGDIPAHSLVRQARCLHIEPIEER